MSSPSYRARIQRLADVMVSLLPDDWFEAELRGAFVSSIRTRFEVYHRSTATGPNLSAEVPAAVAHDLVQAMRAMRDELSAAGNPRARG